MFPPVVMRAVMVAGLGTLKGPSGLDANRVAVFQVYPPNIDGPLDTAGPWRMVPIGVMGDH